MERFTLIDETPNNATIRCWGVWDMVEQDYPVLPNGEICYGMTLAEARSALAYLRIHEHLKD